MLYALYRIGVALAMTLPLRASYLIAGAFAVAYSHISGQDILSVKSNLRVVLGELSEPGRIDRLSRDVFKNFAKYLVDFFRSPKIDELYIKRYVRIEGLHNIDRALARGKGAVLLSAHVGNWELGGIVLSLSGYPVNAVVLTHQDKRINDFFTNRRVMGKMLPIEIGPSLKSCYRALKSNGLLALMGDRDFTKNGMPVNFFGRPAMMPRGPAVFGYRQQAAIVPTFMVREKDDTYRLYMEEPIFADYDKDEKSSIIELADKYLKSIERCIRRYPSQWYVFRDLWETDVARSLRPDTVI